MVVDVVYVNSLHDENCYHDDDDNDNYKQSVKFLRDHSYDPPNKMDQGKVLRTPSRQKGVTPTSTDPVWHH